MNRNNKEIKDNPELFTELVKTEKLILTDTIQLGHKENNVNWKVGQTNVKHLTISEDMVLIVEQSKRESKYGVKLRCSNFTKEPFFRFDSDGPAHRNDFPEIPLEEQSITTPHFNTYKNDGKPFAYKNETLKKSNESKAIVSDINFGVSLFCMETNSKLNTGDFPIVVDRQREFEFGELQDINYDQINFE